VISSFGDATSADIYHGCDTKAARRIRRELWSRVQQKLDLLNACTSVEDLRTPPANRLEKLRGDLAGFYSIRVNQQYRIVFKFANGNCEAVRCTDYHWGVTVMLPEFRVATHPGQILLAEFLEPLRLTQADLARALRIPVNRVNELVRGKRGVTPESALLLSEYFGNSPEFWMNLQTAHDLSRVRQEMRKRPGRIPRIKIPVRVHRRAQGADWFI
jgi:addiction module HigA family antidote